MVIISYVKPFIVVRSDELLTGTLAILNPRQQVLWTSDFNNKDYISVKTQLEWDRRIKVILKTGAREIKKEMTI